MRKFSGDGARGIHSSLFVVVFLVHRSLTTSQAESAATSALPFEVASDVAPEVGPEVGPKVASEVTPKVAFEVAYKFFLEVAHVALILHQCQTIGQSHVTLCRCCEEVGGDGTVGFIEVSLLLSFLSIGH